MFVGEDVCRGHSTDLPVWDRFIAGPQSMFVGAGRLPSDSHRPQLGDDPASTFHEELPVPVAASSIRTTAARMTHGSGEFEITPIVFHPTRDDMLYKA